MSKLISILTLAFSLSAIAPGMAKDVMLMNRIGPSVSELYVANADGDLKNKVRQLL